MAELDPDTAMVVAGIVLSLAAVVEQRPASETCKNSETATVQ